MSVRNPKFEIRGSKSEIVDPSSEIRDQRFEALSGDLKNKKTRQFPREQLLPSDCRVFLNDLA
ncbi:hypothetical protein J42TS3_32850 [Paenibacillus vini]|uniref:Uncharacterized protein n=1 Tax=Paenibacillus vini TaxID=1476024 RepID=A0ABQ4MFQ9_9BACL|nr:hypothetical protein J42TS3_32850 [Paenibacillus vini]